MVISPRQPTLRAVCYGVLGFQAWRRKCTTSGSRSSMSANLIDLFAAHANSRETAVVESVLRPERRRRARTQVHWPVLLLRDRGSAAIETITRNLSSSGFYCLSPAPLAPGESLLCTLKLPAYDPKGQEETLGLECRVLVIRAEAAQGGLFGLACRIEDYHFMTSGTPPR